MQSLPHSPNRCDKISGHSQKPINKVIRCVKDFLNDRIYVNKPSNVAMILKLLQQPDYAIVIAQVPEIYGSKQTKSEGVAQEGGLFTKGGGKQGDGCYLVRGHIMVAYNQALGYNTR